MSQIRTLIWREVVRLYFKSIRIASQFEIFLQIYHIHVGNPTHSLPLALLCEANSADHVVSHITRCSIFDRIAEKANALEVASQNTFHLQFVSTIYTLRHIRNTEAWRKTNPPPSHAHFALRIPSCAIFVVPFPVSVPSRGSRTHSCAP